MARPRAPIDPNCGLNGKGRQLSRRDSDTGLARIASYARRLGLHAWRYKDDKIAITSPRFQEIYGSDAAPLVFGFPGRSFEQTKRDAYSALRAINASEQFKRELGGEQALVSASRRVAPMEPPLQLSQVPGVGRSVDAFLRTMPAQSEASRYLTGRRWLGGSRFLLPVRSALERNGPASADLAMRFRIANQVNDRILGEVGTRRAAVWTSLRQQGFSDEIKNGEFVRFVEHGTVTDERKRAAFTEAQRLLRDLNDEVYETTKALGGDVKPKITPNDQVPTGEYFPHRFDHALHRDPQEFDALVNDLLTRLRSEGADVGRSDVIDMLEREGMGVPTEVLAARLVTSSRRTGQEITTEQARRMIERSFRFERERVAGNLEKFRLGADGYITDAEKAYAITDVRNARRIAELSSFGKDDARLHELFDRIKAEEGVSALQFARDVYVREIGKERVNLSPGMQELYNVQAARLSMSVLPNLGQSANTLLLGELRPFLTAAGRAVRKGRAGGAATERSGALGLQMYDTASTGGVLGSLLGDVRRNGLEEFAGESLASARVQALRSVRKLVTDVGLWPFRLVEKYVNRNLAQQTGEAYFDQIAEVLRVNGRAGLQIKGIGRRLREFDFDENAILEGVQRGDTQFLDEARVIMGLRMSDATQFKTGIQSLPLWASQSELGRFFFQFKTFTLNQARFLGDVLSPRRAREDPVRFAKTLALVTTVYPAVGIALTSARQSLLGPTISSEFLRERLEDASFEDIEGVYNLLSAGAAGLALAGSAGIIADLALTTALGNRFALFNFAVPPAASTILEGLDAAGAVARAAANGGDEREFARAFQSAAGQLGGVGQRAARDVKSALGIQPRLIDRGTPLEAALDFLDREF